MNLTQQKRLIFKISEVPRKVHWINVNDGIMSKRIYVCAPNLYHVF